LIEVLIQPLDPDESIRALFPKTACRFPKNRCVNRVLKAPV
jgi:hypothetical protein